jgi:rhodanese-related sulfurtransferase
MSPTLQSFVAQHPVLIALFAGLLLALIANELSVLTRRYKALTPAGLTQLINREGALLVDVSAQAEYEAGHIVGSKHVAMSQFDPEQKDLAKVRDLPVAVVCKTGQSSGEACKRLGKAGFKKVYWLEGGLNAWRTADLPLVKGRS